MINVVPISSFVRRTNMKLCSIGSADETYSENQSDLLFISLDWTRPKDLRTPLSTTSIEAYFRRNQTGHVNAEFKNFNLNSEDFDVRDVKEVINVHPKWPRSIVKGFLKSLSISRRKKFKR